MISYEQFEKLARKHNIVSRRQWGVVSCLEPGCREDSDITVEFGCFFQAVVAAIAESEKPQHQPYSEIGL